MIATTLIGAVVVLATTDCPQASSIVEMLRHIESAERRFRTTYTYATLTPLPITDDPQWNQQAIIEGHHAEMTYANGTWQLELRMMRSQNDRFEQPLSEAPTDLIVDWTGDEWTEFLTGPRELTIRTKPGNAVQFDVLPYFNMTDGPGMVGGWSLADTLLNSRILSKDEEDSRITLRLAPRGSELFRVTIVLDREPAVRLLEVIYDILVPPGEEHAGEVKTRGHYHVAEWQEYGAVFLPALAYRDGYLFHRKTREAQGLEPIVSRSIFRRHSYQSLSKEQVSKAFSPLELKEGDGVTDEGARLRYRIGANRINVDGFLYDTIAPVPPDARHHLGRLISPEKANEGRDAEQVRRDIEDQQRQVRVEAGGQRIRDGLILGASAFAVVLILGLLFDRVIRHGRKGRCEIE